jgi:hypothetical protein
MGCKICEKGNESSCGCSYGFKLTAPAPEPVQAPVPQIKDYCFVCCLKKDNSQRITLGHAYLCLECAKDHHRHFNIDQYSNLSG